MGAVSWVAMLVGYCTGTAESWEEIRCTPAVLGSKRSVAQRAVNILRKEHIFSCWSFFVPKYFINFHEKFKGFMRFGHFFFNILKPPTWAKCEKWIWLYHQGLLGGIWFGFTSITSVYSGNVTQTKTNTSFLQSSLPHLYFTGTGKQALLILIYN